MSNSTEAEVVAELRTIVARLERTCDFTDAAGTIQGALRRAAATIERVERERDEAIKLARHLRVAQIIYDDGPDESDKAQADLHMSAAILLAKRLVPWGDTRVSDAEAHAIINAAPRAHLTGGRDV